ncbi:MAG: cytochrome ubiquinol oxidase subunit I, partial [Gammaproteobacteria bacterium]
LWDTQKGAPAVLFAWPDASLEANRFEISIPKLASLYLTHRWDGEVRGLRDFAPADRPPVLPVFFSFRLMVAMWGIMALLTVSAWWLWWRGQLYTNALFLRLATLAIPAGYIAVTAGWITTEVGRQPFVVYGLLRTADAVSPSLTGGDVATSLLVYLLVYAVVFGAGFYCFMRMVRQGFTIDPEPSLLDPTQRPARPLSAAVDHLGDFELRAGERNDHDA